jgi:hypothetical protein
MFLKTKFMYPIADKEKFMKMIAFQYDESVKRILSFNEVVSKNYKINKLIKNYLLLIFFKYKNIVPKGLRTFVRVNIKNIIKKK